MDQVIEYRTYTWKNRISNEQIQTWEGYFSFSKNEEHPKNKSIEKDLLFLLEYRDLICIFLVEITIFVTNLLIMKKNGKCLIRTGKCDWISSSSSLGHNKGREYEDSRITRRIQFIPLQKNRTRSRMRWKSHVRFCRVAVRVTYLSTFPLSPPKNQTLPYVKLPEYD